MTGKFSELSGKISSRLYHFSRYLDYKISAADLLTAIDGVVVAGAVQSLLAPSTGVPCAAPGVVVIRTRSGFHLFLQDHPANPTLDLKG